MRFTTDTESHTVYFGVLVLLLSGSPDQSAPLQHAELVGHSALVSEVPLPIMAPGALEKLERPVFGISQPRSYGTRGCDKEPSSG